jgi:hypothetical protein
MLTTTVKNPFGTNKNQFSQAYYDGETVRVWDAVARYYTTAHSLTKHQFQRVKMLTAE